MLCILSRHFEWFRLFAEQMVHEGMDIAGTSSARDDGFLRLRLERDRYQIEDEETNIISYRHHSLDQFRACFCGAKNVVGVKEANYHLSQTQLFFSLVPF